MPQKKYSYPQNDSEVEKEVVIPVPAPVKSKPVPPPVLRPASKAVCNLPPAMAAWQLLHSPKGR